MAIQTSRVSVFGRRLALASALLGWLFDGAEMGLFSLVGRPALRELLLDADEARVGFWFGIMTAGFLVGAATGGVLFGWLGDRAGRVPAMMLSVLTYAVFTGACGLARSPEELFGLRCVASLGMGGEWSLGVALVMELWPDRSRALLAGLIGAAANVGFLLIGLLGLALGGMLPEAARALAGCGLSAEMVERLTANQGWRLMMFSGAGPALLALVLRLGVPESQRWREEQARGATAHWRVTDLAGVLLGALAAVFLMWLWSDSTWPPALKIAASVVAMFIAARGYMHPVTRYFQRTASVDGSAGRGAVQVGAVRRRLLLAAALSGVPLMGTWASLQWAPAWADQLTGGHKLSASSMQIAAAGGAVLGSFLAALAGAWLGRRASYRLLCVASYASILWLYLGHDAFGTGLLVAVFVAGFCTASFYGWLPLYLPELFPTSIRATGQGFGYNFGRILAAIGALQTGALMGSFKGGYPLACSLMSAVYLVGLALIAFAPETRGQKLGE